MAILKANGIEIYHERRGTGSTLLYISGSSGDLRIKPNPLDSSLTNNFDVIAYDQRGLGQTNKPSNPYSMADFADDAAGLLDALDIKKTHVIGVSFGGMVAQELALRHPHKVKSLVLACTSSGGSGGQSYPLHELEALEPRLRVQTHLKLADNRRDDTWIANNNQEWDKLVDSSLSTLKDFTDQASSMLLLEARKMHDTYNRLSKLKIPVFLAGGMFDSIVPPINMSAISAQLPQSVLHFYNGGHRFYLQDPKAFLDIRKWLLKLK